MKPLYLTYQSFLESYNSTKKPILTKAISDEIELLNSVLEVGKPNKTTSNTVYATLLGIKPESPEDMKTLGIKNTVEYETVKQKEYDEAVDKFNKLNDVEKDKLIPRLEGLLDQTSKAKLETIKKGTDTKNKVDKMAHDKQDVYASAVNTKSEIASR